LLGDGQRPTGLDEHRVEQTRQLVDRDLLVERLRDVRTQAGCTTLADARRARSATRLGRLTASFW